MPEELALFLKAGVPSSPKWARWIDGPEVVAHAAREWIDRAFAFDIAENQYWHPLLGGRPSEDAQAITQALSVVRATPPLLPLYGHRFLTTAPNDGPGAVLSVWQPTDSIVYGNDLADYFAVEFGLARPRWALKESPAVPVWDQLFDLF